ncbi:MAG: homoprotocatechuate degradation operon regulator HpaR [Pseudorhodobacter sp.]|nr:MAG: homoprotocatechuate degradation operon regulator HpaR [Pseudorhodobacter sp.]
MSEPNAPLRRTRRSLPIALLRARETVMGPIREMLSQSDNNEQKWRVLRVLDERGPSELTVVAKEACLLLPSLTRIIRAMEDEGLATRATDEGDRRKSIASTTEAGRALIVAHMAESNAIFARLERDFGREKLEQLLDLLDELQTLDLYKP